MRRSGSIVANPVLVGAVTTLVVIVAVFLAYNANNGLPFVPTRELKVQLQNGSELVKGNEVREGGYRVGVVSAMKPVLLPTGSVGAELTLKLDKKAGAMPVDSFVMIRPRSALGLKYVELTKGESSKTINDGGTLPVGQTAQETELDQVYNIFDQKTRSASQVNLRAFGDAFVGRGSDLNQTIQELPKALRLLASVMRNLADPRTQLSNFFRQLDITAQIVAPIADVQAHVFTTMADTFGAIVRDPQALKDTITKNVPALIVGTRSFRIQIPFLRDTAAFSHNLRRAARELRPTLPVLNSALRVGTQVTQESVNLGLYPKLQDALNSLNDLASTPTTNAALRGLTATVGTLNPTVRFLGPFATVCNYWNTFWSGLAEHLSLATPQGTAQHAAIEGGANQNNSFNQMNAPVPANGEGVVPNSGPPEYFHGDPYGHAVDSNGNADCIFGQRGYIRKAARFADRFWKNPDGSPRFQIQEDARPPLGYLHGPTFRVYVNGHGQGLNTNHVPAGETFTSEAGGLSPSIPELVLP
jgi:ABC-type transporter Mla subunit MlaD